jgi:parallel beta-helix repeat protein
MLAAPGGATARSCGGNVVCRCGDTVTADYTLSSDLGPCPDHGLLVRSNVRLDCQGFKITGSGSGEERYGVFLNGKPGAEVSSATIKACRISGFGRGIRLRAASGNIIADNVTTTNGDFRTHVGYGIDLSGESTNNILQGNTVRDNADEGIHVGRGSHRNRLTSNIVTDNYRESLYLLAANGGAFLGNTLGGGGVNSLYLKDSSANYFEGNTFLGKPARIIGDSRDNHFVGNTFSGSGLHILYYKEAPVRRPANNRVTGGTIKGAADCLRFTSTSGNVVADTILSDCRTQVRAESPAGPSENTIVGIAPSAVTLDQGSTLNVGWRLLVHVEDPSGAPLAGAVVQATDVTGAMVWSAVTDDKGSTPAQIVIATTRTESKTTTRTPHTLATRKAGYRPDIRTVSVGEHLTLTISLRPE